MGSFQNTFISGFIAFFVAFIFGFIYPEITLMAIIGCAMFVFFALQFYNKLGTDIPLKELILVIALLQWVVASVFSYHFYTHSQFYYMIIDEERYMSYNVPALLAFAVGLFITFFRRPYINNKNISTEINQNEYLKKGRFLFAVGLIATLLMKFPIPSALRFFFLLLTYLSYVGAFYLYRGNSKYKMLWVFLAFLPTFLNATQSTIFIEMFLWGGFIIIMYTYFNRSSHFVKSGLITVSVLVVVLISTVKSEYREIFYVDEEVNNTVLQNANQANALVGLINKRLEDKSASSDESGQVFVDRLNQGWIIARVMNAVPEYVPFADGETIKDGIYAALLPRVLAPNKQVAGGVTNFERFTGLTLKFTSMNLGIVGEAYANYGERGGIIFMFFYGLLFNLALHLVRSKAVKSEEYLLWIPFLFLCTVKAEDDFGTSLNYFTKSALVMFLFLWITNKVLSIKKENT